jgi:uncharacterized protein
MAKIQDRKLGDEWGKWDGDLAQTELDVEAGRRLFLGFMVFSIVLLTLGLLFIWYMIKPRVVQLSPIMADILQKGLLIVIGLLFIIFSQTILSIVTNRNFIVRVGKFKFSITFLTTFILSLGNKFGVSYDRMGNSFIKVSNSLIRTTRWKMSRSKVIILLPRCLRRPVQKQIIGLAKQYQCLTFTVPGGELARKIIIEQKPTAVIGVACERDLLSGIKDVRHIPVIGIPNQRPEGPCKNTTVDFQKIEEAIRFFMGLDTNFSANNLQPAKS